MSKLIFYFPWYKIEETAYENTMVEIAGWGVRRIVLPQYFYRRECMEKGGFPAKIHGMAQRHGIETAAAHGLLGTEFDLGCADRKALDEHLRYIAELAAVGVTSYTVHAGTHHPIFAKGHQIPESFWGRLEQSLEVLLPAVEQAGITLALENIYEPFPPLKRLAETVHAFRHPRLGMCLDVGHANISEPGLDAVFELMAPLLVTCHLHDNDGQTDTHSAPGTGTVPWAELAEKIKKLPRLMHMETETRTYSRDIWDNFNRLFA